MQNMSGCAFRAWYNIKGSIKNACHPRNYKGHYASGDFFNKIIDWKPFDYYTTQQFVAGLEYYRTIRLQYDGVFTKFSVLVSKPEQEAPEGFREFLEDAARQGYKNLPAAIQKGINDGKIILPQESG